MNIITGTLIDGYPFTVTVDPETNMIDTDAPVALALAGYAEGVPMTPTGPVVPMTADPAVVYAALSGVGARDLVVTPPLPDVPDDPTEEEGRVY